MIADTTMRLNDDRDAKELLSLPALLTAHLIETFIDSYNTYLFLLLLNNRAQTTEIMS